MKCPKCGMPENGTGIDRCFCPKSFDQENNKIGKVMLINSSHLPEDHNDFGTKAHQCPFSFSWSLLTKEYLNCYL